MYHLTPKFKNLSYLLDVLSLPFFIGIYIYLSLPGCVLLYFILYGIIRSVRNFRALEEEAICISDKTIEYRRLGSAFEVYWNDIEKISRNLYFYIQDCLIIDKADIRITESSMFGYPFHYNLFDFQKVFIPLSCFSENWRESELGQQIKQYAPHLFN